MSEQEKRIADHFLGAIGSSQLPWPYMDGNSGEYLIASAKRTYERLLQEARRGNAQEVRRLAERAQRLIDESRIFFLGPAEGAKEEGHR